MSEVTTRPPQSASASSPRRAPPVPVALLRAESAQGGAREQPVGYQLCVVRLMFDYGGGKRLAAKIGDDADNDEHIERARTTEVAAWERLVDLGLAQVVL